MKLSHLKHIIREELKNLKEEIACPPNSHWDPHAHGGTGGCVSYASDAPSAQTVGGSGCDCGDGTYTVACCDREVNRRAGHEGCKCPNGTYSKRCCRSTGPTNPNPS